MAKYIGNQPAFGEFKKLDSLVSSFNGSTTQFNLEYNGVGHTIGDATQLIVSLNGIVQEPLTSYTLGVGGGIIVFSTAPASTDTCHIVSLGGVGSTGTVADGAVTASKLDASLKDYLEETYTADGTQTTYTLTRAALGANSLMLSIDGIVQPSTAFSVSGTTLTISPALPNTTNVRVVHMGVQSGVFVPANNSITAAQIGSLGANLVFDDNSKAVFGEGSDLQIYHDGTNSYIKDAGIGELYIQGDESIRFTNAAGSETLARFISQNRVDLYYDNAIKLSTTSTGVNITGTLTSDGLTVDGDGKITTSSGIGLQLHNSSSNQSYLQFTNSATGESSANGFQIGIDGSEEGLIWHYKNEPIKFATNNSEAMRIDSSGHLLVGTTAQEPSVSNDDSGFSVRPVGTASISRTSGPSLDLNRKSSDGDIAIFRKDGATVGSVATYGGDLIVGTGDTRLRFVDSLDSVLPVSNSTGTSRDAGIDLGHSETRFKDIYTSGGIYLGAASSSTPVAANKLDDYEEGEHTLTINQGGISIHSNYEDAFYTKVGRLVTIQGLLLATSSGDSNVLKINLPFVSKSRTGTQTDYYIGSAMPYNVPTGTGGLVPYIAQGTDKLAFQKTVDNGTWTTLNGTDINNGDHIYFSISYHTN